MKNRIVGILVIIIAILIGFIIFSFNMAMTDIVSTSCGHGSSCTMWDTIEFQTNVSIGILIFVVVLGIYLIFFSKEEKIVTRIKKIHPQVETRKPTKDNYRKIMSKMKKEEKKIFEKILDSDGSVAQSQIVSDFGLSKVKVSRILDKLEGKGLVERRRRGMSNIVILKQ